MVVEAVELGGSDMVTESLALTLRDDAPDDRSSMLRRR